MSKAQKIEHYINKSGWLDKLKCSSILDISFLAAGEYNENWIITVEPASKTGTAHQRYVFRINHGSQIGQGERQITYEYSILDAIKNSGVTPRPYLHDASAALEDTIFDKGVLLMEYLPGTPLDYTRDIKKAAHIFAAIHSQPVPQPNKFVHQLDPVGDILVESQELLSRFADHPKTAVRSKLESYADGIQSLSTQYKSSFAAEPQLIVNTEVNSGNFIINRENNTAHLVDWEKAVVSCRYQDLGHFLAPVTTLWKTDFIATAEDKKEFLKHYKQYAQLDTPLDELSELSKTLEKTIIFRGLSWCYMAWYEYTQQDRAIKNNDTFATIERYLDNIEWFLQ